MGANTTQAEELAADYADDADFEDKRGLGAAFVSIRVGLIIREIRVIRG